jgi:hypothetical protein
MHVNGAYHTKSGKSYLKANLERKGVTRTQHEFPFAEEEAIAVLPLCKEEMDPTRGLIY